MCSSMKKGITLTLEESQIEWLRSKVSNKKDERSVSWVVRQLIDTEIAKEEKHGE